MMYTKAKINHLSLADKDLILEFMERSLGRVLNKHVTSWNRPIPQGVSVFIAHPGVGFEYLFTKDEKADFEHDSADEIQFALDAYGNRDKGGIVLYMHSAMVHVASKHRAHPY